MQVPKALVAYKIIALEVNYYIDRTIQIYLVKTNMTPDYPYAS